MPYDYTDAPPPRDFDAPIPHGTIATVTMHIRAGSAGEDSLLKRSKDGSCEMLDVEFQVVDGEYKRRKFWENMILAGTTDGHAKAAEISRGKLRTIIESARGIRPDDTSPQARERRTVSLKDFDNLSFIAKIGIDKGKPKDDGSGQNYPDRNILSGVITPDRKEYHPVEQAPPFDSGSTSTPPTSGSSAPPVAKPPWAA